MWPLPDGPLAYLELRMSAGVVRYNLAPTDISHPSSETVWRCPPLAGPGDLLTLSRGIATAGQVGDAWPMSDIDELKAVEQVCQRLVVRFPTVPMTTVRATVQEMHAKLDGPVRTFVPILIEHGAKDRLSAIAASRDAS